MRGVLDAQFVRFLLVGALNTAFSYSVYAALLLAGLNYALANFGALLLGILFSFRTQGRLVFGNRDNRLLLRFAAAWTGVFCVHTLLIALLIRAGLNAYVAGLTALVPVTVMSYVIQRFFVFRAPKRDDSLRSESDSP